MKKTALVAWLKDQGILFCWRTSMVRGKGFPHVIVFERPAVTDNVSNGPCRGGYLFHPNMGKIGAAIWLGSRKLRFEQIVWQDELAARGWLVNACAADEDAIAWLKGLGYGKQQGTDEGRG